MQRFLKTVSGDASTEHKAFLGCLVSVQRLCRVQVLEIMSIFARQTGAPRRLDRIGLLILNYDHSRCILFSSMRGVFVTNT